MKAAVLHRIGLPPVFEEVPDPVPADGEQLVQVTAAPLNAIDRALASGSHYANPGALPTIPGVVGAGRLPDGARVLFGSQGGTMAERAATGAQWCYPIPDGLDDALVAAAWNPGLSAWMTLTWRAELQAGQTLLVQGATGVTGKLAVQLARRLGAGRIVASGRNPDTLRRLADLGADATIALDGRDDALAGAYRAAAGESGYDVIVDYLWGHPTEVLLDALGNHDLEARSSRTRLVQVGEMAGSHVSVPAGVLRSAGIEICGMGSGTVPPPDVIGRGLGELMGLLERGDVEVDFERVPLARVEEVWARDQRGRRPVFVP
jgi:NADPH2:quinone reductase